LRGIFTPNEKRLAVATADQPPINRRFAVSDGGHINRSTEVKHQQINIGQVSPSRGQAGVDMEP
jgi:hypothetical protein